MGAVAQIRMAADRRVGDTIGRVDTALAALDALMAAALLKIGFKSQRAGTELPRHPLSKAPRRPGLALRRCASDPTGTFLSPRTCALQHQSTVHQ
jgi:hypothetical protein